MSVSPKVLGYYADGNSSLSPKAIDYRLFTHLNHAFATVGKSGEILFPDTVRSRELCDRGHAAGVKVLLSVGGANSGPAFSKITANWAATMHTAELLTDAARLAGYDGIDIDWEFPATLAESDQMNALVEALRQRLPTAILTMATPGTNWNGKWFDRDALLRHLDFVNVMAYDFHGPWSDHAGYNAPLFPSATDVHPECRGNTVDGAMEYYLRQKSWPRDKVVMGIPLYGHGFRASSWGKATSGSYSRSDVRWADIGPLLGQGWRRQWDNASQVPFLVHPDAREIISYDDRRSVTMKGQYARKCAIGGIFFWEISLDYNGFTNPLIRAARDAMGAA